jgi:TolA-binding protein
VQLGQYNDIIATANRLLANDKAPHDIKQEAMYQRATASIAVGDTTQALADYAQLAEDPRTPYGAEAAYLLAQHAFDNGELTIAEERSNLLIEKGSSQAYWVARIFILLADIYYAKGDTYLPQQYLTQLQQNYPGSNDDIAQRIEEKLKVMNP